MPILTKFLCTYKFDENNILLLNTLTSAIDVVDSDTLKNIDSIVNGNNEHPELAETLKKRGYLFESAEDENNLLNRMHLINKSILSRNIGMDYTICPTMGCNLRCTYCFENCDQHNDCSVMTESQLNTILNYIDEHYNKMKELIKDNPNKEEIEQTMCKIILFGGEPLLPSNHHIIERILPFARSHKMSVQIITNGTTVSQYRDLLTEYKDMVSLQITLDGDKNAHDIRRIRADRSGTFDDVCKGVSEALDIGLYISLRINVDRENIDHLDTLKDVFLENGWLGNPLFMPYVSPVLCFGKQGPNILKESELLETLYKNEWYGAKDSFILDIVSSSIKYIDSFFNGNQDSIKPWKASYCEATTGKSFCFSPDGNIATCLTYAGNKKGAIGSFDETGIHLDSDAYKKWISRDPFNMEKCKNCKFILMCGGGCPAAAIEKNNSLNCPVCTDIERALEVYIKHNKSKFLF